MLLFRSEELVDRWCEQRGTRRGEVLSLEQVWELSQHWYGNRLSPDFHGRDASQAVEIFRRVGLGSEFWSL